jgi:hypothetical protein
LSAVVASEEENDMTRSTKSEQLRLQLKALDFSLVPESARGRVRPVAIKVTEGGDRVFGET